MVSREPLSAYFDQLLEPGKFRDYGPNGLQVEGRAEIHKVVSGVTASLALIQAAVQARADALIVHHGLFWRGQDGRITGWLKERLALLLAHQINLYAYHLPLDAHPSLGNNAQLAKRLGLMPQARFGEQDLGWIGTGSEPLSASQWQEKISSSLARTATCIALEPDRVRQRVAWCSGGAQSYFESAIAAGADLFITGELSEPQTHLARETGCAFIACGHHASERYGAAALGKHIAEEFGLVHAFIDIDNPA